MWYTLLIGSSSNAPPNQDLFVKLADSFERNPVFLWSWIASNIVSFSDSVLIYSAQARLCTVVIFFSVSLAVVVLVYGKMYLLRFLVFVNIVHHLDARLLYNDIHKY